VTTDPFSVTTHGDVGVLAVPDDFDSSEELAGRLAALVAQAPARVVVDLSAVSFFDSAAFSALIRAVEDAERSGVLTEVVCSPPLRAVLDVMGLGTAWTLHDSVERALAAG
jgi:anti-sigma B factor antagonist